MPVLRRAAAETAFYRQRLADDAGVRGGQGAPGLLTRLPLTRPADLALEKLRTGDAYAGRLARGRQPLVTFQLDYAEEARLYLGLDRADLRVYAQTLRRCLALLGLHLGDGLAIFDYGTSPVTYLASACYTPYLAEGAADGLGGITICNDGVPNMSQRAVEILKYVHPRYFVMRVECMFPFMQACEAEGVRASRYTEALVATRNEGGLDRGLRELCRERLGLPVYQLPRADLALFLAQECPACGYLHTWADRYLVEVVDPDSLQPLPDGREGRLVITNHFARVCPAVRILTQLEGRLVAPGCALGPRDVRLSL